MTINTRRFGQVEVSEEDVVTFPEGLVGLSRFKRFVMLRDPESANLVWLQSADKEDFALATLHSTSLGTEYKVEVTADEVESIRLDKPDDAEVFVVINRVEGTYYANLRGPLIINAERMLGKQVVLRNPAYGVRHPLQTGHEDAGDPGQGAWTAQAAHVSISARS